MNSSFAPLGPRVRNDALLYRLSVDYWVRRVERHLPMSDSCLRLQQLVERLHLRRQRLGRLQGVERHDRPVHGPDSRGHGLFLGW